MSVYTIVSEQQVEQFLQRFDLGRLTRMEGISEGIENTNYFVDTEHGQFVLTLFEWLDESELPYFLKLMSHVASAGLPCPRPIADHQGKFLHQLLAKPAALITRLKGHTIQEPSVEQCRQVGDLLAQMHLVMRDFHYPRENNRDTDWFRAQGARLQPKLSATDQALLYSEISYQEQRKQMLESLPGGTIHADLFKDNVLFDGNQLSGVIDFYYACRECWLYDVAVTINDWCRLNDQTICLQRYRALLSAYHARRPYQANEHDAWQDVLRRASLRFWLSRLGGKFFPRDGEITHIKDYDVFKNILLMCRNSVPSLTEATSV